ncbi:MAG TPA: preprotein translocase subunit SecE [Bacteroidota bacterium]|jgi:preprotein translocase subunit SecE|nr:preprotein translocase subunit SecE [Bacteroidota bacterium]
MKEKILEFFNGVTKEMRKVTWPTKDELKESTVIVLVSTLILSAFVFLVDSVFTKAMELLLGS